ncbi:MAG TPA: MFS transporter [Terriglobales bacterium]|nr:MFS transporter [Terriglobales bacterium]
MPAGFYASRMSPATRKSWAKAGVSGSFSHWFMNALISGILPLMAAPSGAYPFVFFLAIMMVGAVPVVLLVYPETKGFRLEEMQKRVVATGSTPGNARFQAALRSIHSVLNSFFSRQAGVIMLI